MSLTEVAQPWDKAVYNPHNCTWQPYFILYHFLQGLTLKEYYGESNERGSLPAGFCFKTPRLSDSINTNNNKPSVFQTAGFPSIK